MVYCGRPSSACEACRVRKTKCDADPAGCKQCCFVGRVCPGYRSRLDVVFRDETPKLIRKAAKRAQKETAAKARSPLMPPDSNHALNQQPKSRTVKLQDHQPDLLNLRQSLVTSLNERAQCFFVSNFGDGIIFAADEEIDSNGYQSLIRNSRSTLQVSFEAVSLLSFANHTRDLELTEHSRSRYLEAIRLTNAAIASADEAVEDDTLLAVNFLGLYEVLSGQTKRSMRHWADHCNGAAALLKLRGNRQFDTADGCRLFRQIRASLITGCLQWTMRVPDHIIKMSSIYAERVGLTGIKMRLFEAGPIFCQFRYDVRNGIITNPLEILKGALRIDQPFAEVCNKHPPHWHFDTVKNEELDSELIYQGTYHVYPHISVAGWWNLARSLRILIHMEIYHTLRNASVTPPNMTDIALSACSKQLQKSTEICRQLSADILGSVPQLLGYLDTQQVQSPRSAFILVWPVWTAGCMSLASSDTRAYCGRILHHIALKIGHRHAFRLGSLLMGEAEPVVWRKDLDHLKRKNR